MVCRHGIWSLFQFMLYVNSRKTSWQSLNIAHKPAIFNATTYPKIPVHSALSQRRFLIKTVCKN